MAKKKKTAPPKTVKVEKPTKPFSSRPTGLMPR